MNTNMKIMMHANSCNCAACTPVPTLGIEMPYNIKENCLAVACPKVAAMLSEKDKKLAFEVTTGSKRKLTFVCPDCGQEFESRIFNIVRSVDKGFTGCSVCAGRKIIPGINDLASKYPEIAAMWSNKNKKSASEIAVKCNKKAIFVCPDCGEEFEAKIEHVVCSVSNGNTGCPVCRGLRVAPGINDLASQCPKAAAMWSSKNKLSASEVAAKSGKKAFFVCPDCGHEFETDVIHAVRSVSGGTTGCPVCAGRKIVPGINDLTSQCPEAAAMWSSKNKLSASEVAVKSNRKAFFKCRDCGQEFEAMIKNVVRSVINGTTGCPVCAGLKVVSSINDLASQCPEAAAMWSSKNKLSASEVAVKSNKKAFFKCRDCGQEFEATIQNVVRSVINGTTGCPVCAGLKVVSSINDLASQCPEAAAMWSSKNKLSASEVAVKSNKKAFFKCRDCGQEFEAAIQNVVRSVGNGFTGCYDCKMRRKNAISKPECFLVRPMMAFAGENGIANPFADVRNILGENSLLGLDFVDHIQKLCGEYNGVAWHGDDEHVVRDRFKFEAAHKAGYTMIRIQEPGLEVLDPKYDIVMPEGFRDSGGRYNAEIMEEVGRKVIHLLEEIYGRKASPEIWALNNFKEFEIWYDANKKELEANARKKGPKGKTAAKMAA